MSWFIDDINLSTLAFNVSNRSAGWRAPAKRGENLVIPGRNGAQWLPNKPFEEGSISLSMWAVGAKEDGRFPDNGDQRRQVRANLDKLTALFGQTHKLLNVVQITSTAFGVTNSALSPGFETVAAETYYTYQNGIINPSMRRKAIITQIQNLAMNPAMVTPSINPANGSIWFKRYENIYLDPWQQRGRDGANQVMASNYWSPANYEAQSSGDSIPFWTNATNVSATIETNASGDRTANPTGGTKVARLLATAALGSGASLGYRASMGINGLPAAPPLFRFRARRAQTATGTRTIQMRMVLLNGTTVTSTANAWQSQTIPAYATWTDIVYDTALAVASQGLTISTAVTAARVEFRTGEAWASGDGIVMDQFVMNANNQFIATNGFFDGKAGPFFDGDSAWNGPMYNTDGGGTSSNISRWMGTYDNRWIAAPATGSNSPFYAFAYLPMTDPNGSSVNFTAFGFVAGAPHTFTQDLASPTAGTPYTMRFLSRALSGAAIKVELQKKGTADADFVTVDTIDYVGTGATASNGAHITGTNLPYIGTNSYVARDGDVMRMRVTVPTRTDGFPSAWIGQVAVGSAHVSFYGGSNNTSNSLYSWEGEANNSRTIYSQRRVKRVTSQHAMVSTVIPSTSTTAVNTAEAFCQGDGLATGVTFEAVSITNNQGLFVSADVLGQLVADSALLGVTSVTARLDVELLNASSAVIATMSAAAMPLNISSNGNVFKNTYLRIPAESIPTGVTQARASINMVNPRRTASFHVTNLMILPAGLLPSQIGVPDYFDGGTTGQTDRSWTSNIDDSISNYLVNYTTGFSVIDGVPIAPGTANVLQAKSPGTDSYNIPQVTFGHAMGSSYSAGEYTVGLEVTCKAEDFDGVERPEVVPINVWVDLYSGTTLVDSRLAATITSKESGWKQIQGVSTATASWTQVRVRFVADNVIPYTILAKINTFYLLPSAAFYTMPIQRINYNGVDNPDFTNGLDLWRTIGPAPTAVSTTKGPGYTLGTGTLLTSDIPVTAGGVLNTAFFARNGIVPTIRWCKMSRRNLTQNPNMTSTTNMTSGGGAFLAISSGWAQTGTTSLQVISAGPGSSSAYPVGTTGAMARLGIVPGKTYTYSAYFRMAAVQTGTLDTAARRIAIGLEDASGNINYSYALSAAAANTVQAGTRLSVTFSVPADARNVFIRLMNGSQVNGESVNWDAALLEEGSTLNSYFAGDSTSTSAIWYRWAGTTTFSASELVTYATPTTTVLPTADDTVQTLNSAASTVPAGTEFAVLAFTGSGGEVAYAYGGADFANHEAIGYYDPTYYPYWDGSSASDPYQQPTYWTGTVDNSVSRVSPRFATGWVNTLAASGSNVHVWSAGATSRPPGSVGPVGAIPRILKNTTKNYRTVGYARSGKSFLSGEISINHFFGLTVKVQVYGASDATASGTILFDKTITNRNGEIVSWRDIPATNYTHFYVQLVYSETIARAGYPIRIDNLLMTFTDDALGSDYPNYFDGGSNGGAWNADGTSQYYGGGRSAQAEVTDAIDMTSMAGGTRAEFNVEMSIPSSFWADLILSTASVSATSAQMNQTAVVNGVTTKVGTAFPLVPFNETTAPIDDAKLTLAVSGTVTDLTLTDVASGASLSISGTIPNGLVIDNSNFTVATSSTSLIGRVTRKKSNQLLPLTPTSSTSPPALNIMASGSGSVTVSIVARRKYMVA